MTNQPGSESSAGSSPIDEVLRKAIAEGDFPGLVAGILLGNGTSYTAGAMLRHPRSGLLLAKPSTPVAKKWTCQL